jgi:hypothetical protein
LLLAEEVVGLFGGGSAVGPGAVGFGGGAVGLEGGGGAGDLGRGGEVEARSAAGIGRLGVESGPEGGEPPEGSGGIGDRQLGALPEGGQGVGGTVRAGEEEVEMGVGLIDGLGFRIFRPDGGEDDTVFGSRHRDIEGAHALGGFDAGALGLDAVVAQGGRAEEAEFDTAVVQPAGCGARSGVARLFVELGEVDVLEVEPFGAVDGHHLDGVRGAVLRPPLFGLARFGDAAAQGAEDRGQIAAAGLDGGEELAEEAVEVGEAVGAEVTGGLDRFGEEEAAELLDEDIGRLGLEGAAEDGQVVESGEEALLPAA